MSNFHLEIITPTQLIDEGKVEYLRAPSEDGLFGVLAGHTDAIVALHTGEIKVRKGDAEKIYACSGGYAEITADRVQLLVETAEAREDIDVQRAEEALSRARERLTHKLEEVVDEERAVKSLERALNRLHIARN